MDMRSVVSQTQRFAAFTGVTKPNPGDKFFLVMGMTGSGKSTFVGRCTGEDVTVGHGLYSCKSLSNCRHLHQGLLFAIG
jgi:ABC-type proline/glycine betaine transport system ATPase subunit